MKNKAFTILEALTSMILISIIIGLIFVFLNIVVSQMSFFSSEINEELTYQLFDTTIKRDINKSHDFAISGQQITLKYYDGSEINYSLSKNFILRKRGINTDTFKLQILNFKIRNPIGNNAYNKVVELNFNIMGATLETNYFLGKNRSQIINNTFYNED